MGAHKRARERSRIISIKPSNRREERVQEGLEDPRNTIGAVAAEKEHSNRVMMLDCRALRFDRRRNQEPIMPEIAEQ